MAKGSQGLAAWQGRHDHNLICHTYMDTACSQLLHHRGAPSIHTAGHLPDPDIRRMRLLARKSRIGIFLFFSRCLLQLGKGQIHLSKNTLGN